MTAGNPLLSLLDLPVEILENVVLRLYAREILELRTVRSTHSSCLWYTVLTEPLPPLSALFQQLNRTFRDLIDASPAIQYRVDLFSAALEDDLRDTSLVLADRRAHLEGYHSRWDRFSQAKQSSVELPPHTQRVIDGEILACVQEVSVTSDKIDIAFMRLPSISRGIQRKQWVVRGLPKNGSGLKTHPGLDMLVFPEVLCGGR